MSGVTFQRYVPTNTDVVAFGEGEDDGIGQTPAPQAEPQFIGVNPKHVSLFFAAREPNVVIIKGPDGRGFKVLGTFAEVEARLVEAGWNNPQDETLAA